MELKYGIGKEKADEIMERMLQAASSLHITLSRAIVDVETLKDCLTSLGRYRHAMKHDYEMAIKSIERCLSELDEKTLNEVQKASLMDDYQMFSDAIDWFFSKRVYTCGEGTDRDMEYRARFAPHPVTYTDGEYNAFEKGFVQGAMNERARKMDIKFQDSYGTVWSVGVEDSVRFILDAANRNGGFPKELHPVKVRKTSEHK